MEVKKYKIDRNIIWQELLRVAFIFLLAVAMILLNVFLFYEQELTVLIALYFAAGILFIIAIISILRAVVIYHTAQFYIENDELCYESRFIYKINEKVPLSKISSVNIKRSLFQILTGCSLVECSSGSVITSSIKEFSVLLNKNRAESLARVLKEISHAAKQGETNLTLDAFGDAKIDKSSNNNIKTAKAGQYIAYGFLNPMFYIIALTISIVVLSQNNNWSFIYDLIAVVIAIISAFIITFLIGFLRYYKYSVHRENDTLHISYGLLSQKKYSLPIYRVNAIKIARHPLMMIFGRYSVFMQVIGYGSDESDGSRPYLSFFCTRKNMLESISDLLPEFNTNFKKQAPPRKSILHFLIIPPFIAIICLGFFAVMLLLLTDSEIVLFAFAAIILIVLIDAYMQYTLSFAGVSDNLLCVKAGGIFTSEVYIRHSAIQQISIERGCIRKKQGLGTCRIAYYANLGRGAISIRHFSEDFMQRVQNIINY